MKDKELYSSAEVAVMIGIKQQSVGLYYKKYGIGTMGTRGYGRALLFTLEDIELIKSTDGRKR